MSAALYAVECEMYVRTESVAAAEAYALEVMRSAQRRRDVIRVAVGTAREAGEDEVE